MSLLSRIGIKFDEIDVACVFAIICAGIAITDLVG